LIRGSWQPHQFLLAIVMVRDVVRANVSVRYMSSATTPGMVKLPE
jgi:hypothetical protein